MKNRHLSESGNQLASALLGKLHFAAILQQLASSDSSEGVDEHIWHAVQDLPVHAASLAHLLAAWAISQNGRDPIATVQHACNTLAKHSRKFEPVRHLALGEVHFACAIDAHAQDRHAASRRSMLQAWRWNPQLLANRGSLSIFARSLLPIAQARGKRSVHPGGTTLARALSEASAAVGYSLGNSELIAGGYSTDKVFLVAGQNGDRLILRLSEDGFLRERAAVLQTALSVQVPAPRVIAADQHSEQDPRSTWLLEELMPGAAFLPPTMSAAAERSILADLAGNLRQLHSVKALGYGPIVSSKLATAYPSFTEWFDDLLTSVCLSCTLFSLPKSAFAALNSAAATLRSAPTHQPVLCHGDLARGNILVEDGRIRALIDWEDAVGGDPAWDIAVLFTHMSNYWYPERDAGLLSWVLDKYTDGDSSALRQRVEAYRLLFLVTQLAWLSSNDTNAHDYAEACHAILSQASKFRVV